MNCPICRRKNEIAFHKKGSDYHLCSYCLTCYCESIDQSGMVGGGFELERNTRQNIDRIIRFKNIIGSDKFTHLDFGCGHGMLVKDCKKEYIESDGYDRYNPEFANLDDFYEKYEIISLIEVIEHLSYPFVDINVIEAALKPSGILYIETSFVDLFVKENAAEDLMNEYYVEPEVGHNTIFSHFSLDLLMLMKGFTVGQHINQNVRIYQKPC